jgi:hypothetical protein
MRYTALFCATLILAYAGPQAKAAQRFDDDALSLYSMQGVAKAQVDQIARRFEIVSRQGDKFEVLVPPAQADAFRRLAPKARLIEFDIQAALREAEATWGGGYHDIASVQSDLTALAKAYPDLVRLENYGKSEGGRDLVALKLTDNPDSDEKEPQVLLTAATHGNEIITTEVVFGLVQDLLDGYGKDARLTKMVDGLEIWFIPVVNPDGYSRRSRYANGIDPNRAYPVPGEPARKANACIQNLIGFFDARNFKGSIDFHSYSELILFPWGYSQDEVRNSALREFESLTKSMAKDNGYRTGQISRILYTAEGNSADYYFDKKGTIALGIEVGKTHTPSPASIPAAVKSQRESTWVFLEHFL